MEYKIDETAWPRWSVGRARGRVVSGADPGEPRVSSGVGVSSAMRDRIIRARAVTGVVTGSGMWRVAGCWGARAHCCWFLPWRMEDLVTCDLAGTADQLQRKVPLDWYEQDLNKPYPPSS